MGPPSVTHRGRMSRDQERQALCLQMLPTDPPSPPPGVAPTVLALRGHGGPQAAENLSLLKKG